MGKVFLLCDNVIKIWLARYMAKLSPTLLYSQVYPYTGTVTLKSNFTINQSLAKIILLKRVNQGKLNLCYVFTVQYKDDVL